MAVLGSSINGFGYRAVTTGQSIAAATPVSVAGNSLSASGIIESTSQHDYYGFNVPAAGSVTMNVNVAPFGAMLHSILEIHNTTDATLYSAASSTTLAQSLTVNLPAGRYYAIVKSYGQYGDVGQYTLSAKSHPRPRPSSAGTLFTTGRSSTAATRPSIHPTTSPSPPISNPFSPARPVPSPISPATRWASMES